ncbi:hypothetical protein, partial [Rhizobium lusitanum]|uniref:hypothetical protein n=1 Tax=Rhizobium lusitanum TaxID=293958 RepID=UPI001953C7F2
VSDIVEAGVPEQVGTVAQRSGIDALAAFEMRKEELRNTLSTRASSPLSRPYSVALTPSLTWTMSRTIFGVRYQDSKESARCAYLSVMPRGC